MIRLLCIAVALAGVVGCAGATLPYKPERQPSGARVSAAYQVVADRLRVEFATNGPRVEDATIVKPDGSTLRPQRMEVAPPVARSSPLRIGIGGGTYGGGLGTGVSVSSPVGGSSTDGNTVAVFPAAEAGPPPWRVHVKLVGVEPVVIVVGAAPDGRR